MKKSFRWRLALLTTGMCGLVLFAFSMVVWKQLHDHALHRMDHEIHRIGTHHLQGHAVAGHIHLHAQEVFLSEQFQHLALWLKDDHGETLSKSPDWRKKFGDAVSADVPYATVRDGGTDWRIGIVRNRHATIVVAVDLSHYNEDLDHLRDHWFIALAISLFIAGLGAWWHASRALRPLMALTRSMEEVTAHRLDRRIPEEGGHTEFKRMIRVFNGMLERLERSFEQAVRFSADASHEMKTPLTIMQGQVEAAMRDMPEGSEAQRALATQFDEIQRLKSLVQKLLLLSQADSGSLQLQAAAIDLSAAVRSVCEDTRVLAPETDVREEIQPAVRIEADDGLLQQVLQNLASNAIKYNADCDRWIAFEVTSRGSDAILTVANAGPAIPKEDAERVFDRFFRIDTARNRRTDGLGLGLSLAREIARAHGGDLVYEAPAEGGNRFRLRMPLARSDS